MSERQLAAIIFHSQNTIYIADLNLEFPDRIVGYWDPS